jgi:cell division protein FtsW (lipid II flippase)
MSPQLSNWIYGYFPSSFPTEVRYGGFRPVVFMENGLVLAFFAATSLLAAVALWRARIRIRPFAPPAVIAYLGVLLVLCKAAGALMYGLFGGPLIALARPRLQMRLAVMLVGIGLLYPALRATQLFPTSSVLGTMGLINEERASSLAFRFRQEDLLLAHAEERPWFGWGRYARSRVFNEYTGGDDSVTDGMWIITLGSFGIFGFVAQFGLLAFSVFRAAPLARLIKSEQDRVLIAALALIVALNVVEQLPNAGISGWSWVLAGALIGRSELIQAEHKSEQVRKAQIDPRLQSRQIDAEGYIR